MLLAMSLYLLNFEAHTVHITLEYGSLDVVGGCSHIELLLGEGEAVAEEALLTVGCPRFECDGVSCVYDATESRRRRRDDEQCDQQHVCSPRTLSYSWLIFFFYQHFLFRRRSLAHSFCRTVSN